MLSSKPSVYLWQNIQDNFFNSVPTTPPSPPPPPPKKGLCRRRFPTNRTDRGLKPRFFWPDFMGTHNDLPKHKNSSGFFPTKQQPLFYIFNPIYSYSMGGTGIDPQQN